MTWQESIFTIMTERVVPGSDGDRRAMGPRGVRGWVSFRYPAFGIDERRPGRFAVTHLPSCFGMPIRGTDDNCFDARAKAIAFVEQASTLTDWTGVGAEGLPAEVSGIIGPQLLAIAQDLMKGTAA